MNMLGDFKLKKHQNDNFERKLCSKLSKLLAAITLDQNFEVKIVERVVYSKIKFFRKI